MSLNMHRLVKGAISKVNPYVPALIKKNIGQTVDKFGDTHPKYEYIQMDVQKQEVSQEEIREWNAQGVQGIFAKIYTDGNWLGVNRQAQTGQNFFIIDGEEWMVIAVPEMYTDWTKVICCLQVG